MTGPAGPIAALVVVPDGVRAVERGNARAWRGAPVLHLRAGRTIVGRGPGVDAVVPYRSLSRRHARLELSRDGAWTVVDLGSTNGTWVGERRALAGDAHSIRPGDVLRLGGVRLLVARPLELRDLGIGAPLGADAPLRLPPDGIAARSLVDMLASSPAMLERFSAPFLLQLPDASARWGASCAGLTITTPGPGPADRGALGEARVHSFGTAARAVVGRDDASQVVLRVDGVSRSHATLFRGRHGWHLVDLGSRNGTSVDGAAVRPGLSVPVDARSVLTFGSYRALLLTRFDVAGLVRAVRGDARRDDGLDLRG